jgi:hypothetical protein
MMSRQMLSLTNSTIAKTDIFFFHEYDTLRVLPKTVKLGPNILRDATEFITVILFDGKLLTLSQVGVGPRIIAVES